MYSLPVLSTCSLLSIWDQDTLQVPITQSVLATAACLSALCLSIQPLFFSCPSNCCNAGSLLSAAPAASSFWPASYPANGSFRLIADTTRNCQSSIWSGCFCRNEVLWSINCFSAAF